MIITKVITTRGRTKTYEELGNHSNLEIEVECDVCKKHFISSKYRIVRNGHEMCQACALKERNSKHLKPGTTYGRLTVLKQSDRPGYSVCECSCKSKTIKEYSNQSLKRGKTKSCGCLNREIARNNTIKYLSDYMTKPGKDHRNWKGGISPDRNRIEKTKEYKSFRTTVFERDNNQCQKCGTRKNVQIHHICNFRDYPDIRTNVDNGVCLCLSCHKQFHKIFGLSHTTLAQYREFIAQ